MRRLILASLLLVGCANSADTNLPNRLIVMTDLNTDPTCATATGAGDICAADALEAEGALDVGGASTLTGAVTMSAAATVGTTLGVTGDLTCSGGAGALTFDDSASSIVVPDNDATALLLGSTGQLGLITIDTTNTAEEVNIVGTTATSAFRVDTGTATFDEGVTITGATTFADFSSAVVTQESTGATCTVGDWSIDTDTTKELCYCGATNTWYCISFTTETGPSD